MIATALIVGFFTAIGWWGGTKVTSAIDQPQVCEVRK
jgi:hypothetical protein